MLLSVPSIAQGSDTGSVKYVVRCEFGVGALLSFEDTLLSLPLLHTLTSPPPFPQAHVWTVERTFQQFRDLHALTRRSLPTTAPFPPAKGLPLPSKSEGGDSNASSSASSSSSALEKRRSLLDAYVSELGSIVGDDISGGPAHGRLRVFVAFSQLNKRPPRGGAAPKPSEARRPRPQAMMMTTRGGKIARDDNNDDENSRFGRNLEAFAQRGSKGKNVDERARRAPNSSQSMPRAAGRGLSQLRSLQAQMAKHAATKIISVTVEPSAAASRPDASHPYSPEPPKESAEEIDDESHEIPQQRRAASPSLTNIPSPDWQKVAKS